MSCIVAAIKGEAADLNKAAIGAIAGRRVTGGGTKASKR
jgi:hypothetical protein